MKKPLFRSLVLNVSLLLAAVCPLAASSSPPFEWFFWPRYTLPVKAENYAGPRLPYPLGAHDEVEIGLPPLLYRGEPPTDRTGRLLEAKDLPSGAFAVELWIVDHVNQPVATLVSARQTSKPGDPVWSVGYRRGEVFFTLQPGGDAPRVDVRAKPPRGWKSHWHHIVAVQTSEALQLYHNGVLVAEHAGALGLAGRPRGDFLEASAYLEWEPRMILGNLLRELRVHQEALSPERVKELFATVQARVEAGIIYPDLFHFIAGPYLNLVDQRSMRIVCEGDRPTTARIRYGTQLPLEQSLELMEPKRIHEAILEGLMPATPYFYEVELTDAKGARISSGVLTFQTAVGPESAWSFAVIGDTEARPHINDALAKAIWGERPNFLINVGDLTDGGQRDHKFEWNYEYFLGMNQLTSRVPMFPVPGNGESDLHWYRQYHVLPGAENIYSFRYANAEFFMLDSNQPMTPGSEQYRWLEERLAQSTATWKIACHHHPTFSSDEDDYGDSWKGRSEQGDPKVRPVAALYERYGVDLVFFGHLHSYERTWPLANGKVDPVRGVRYIQAGGGGGNLENAAPSRSWFTDRLYRGHHYGILTIHEGSLYFRMQDVEGRLRDSFELRKDTAAKAP